ncbi:hypothetical protein BOX15_Mlig020446g2 [Macrostomum lignano]|uniref:Protein kinase domain-containing protein n=1 Tax=Macrostomum lignano TaxID=282301 RepID=A0A267G6R5_9PLAT|nr:hypothetical protein BOX15_Mlig020446g2 [Macrostomum lignano]
MATQMERKLRAALEAGDSEELQRLCGEVGSNIELDVGGFDKQDYPFEEVRRMPLAHHVACKPVSSSCLELLIDRFGTGCLTYGNGRLIRETPVHLAAQHQDESWMKLVKEKGGRGCLRIANEDGKTVAHFAAMNRKSNSCLKWLVKELGSDCLTVPDKYGNTAVHLSAEHQGIESLEWIKRQIGTDCFRLNGGFWKRTAFHFAAQKSDNSNLKWLVKEVGSDCLTVPDKDGNTAVHLAAWHQGIESLEWIKRQIGTDCFRLKTKSNRTAFQFAAEKSDNSKLKWLVKELGSDCLTVPDEYGNTAVHLAAQHQGIESLEWIKRQIGADCFRLKGDRTAFHFAAKKSDNSNLKWLVKELGNDCLTVPDSYGNTAVHLAAKHQGIESLEWIKRQIGADCFRLKGWLDKTAFHFAAEKSDNSNLKWLVKELGSHCLTVPDEYGNTAVHLAARHQPVDSLQFIFDQIGAEMFSLKNNRGETPADVVASRWCYADQSEKRDWISSTQRRLEASRPPAGSSAPTAASAGAAAPRPRPRARQSLQPPGPTPVGLPEETRAKKQLDPSFTDWDFILQDDKKQLIGRGGFGEVYKALTDRNQTVAVKVLPLSGTGQSRKLQKAVEMEKRGVEIIKRLSHPNILQFLKCEQKSDGLYIFTELVSGHSLFELMQRQNKPFKESGVRDFSRQICSGLNFLHCQPEGAILHRDIKSSNIMLTNEGVIKLIDFGLAKEIIGTCGLSTGVDPKGTPYFMAPELFMGEGDSIPYSAKTDVWAFGCTVYELTAMEPPDANVPQIRIGIVRCGGRAMPRIADGFSAGMKDFYLRCVDYDPRKRADTTELLRHSFLSASS